MKITLISVGRNADKDIQVLIDRYLDRLKHYTTLDYKIIPDIKGVKNMSPDAQKTAEGQSILALLQPSDHVMLLDERGKEYTSRGFSEVISRHLLAGTRNVVFVIGGPYGFSQAVYDRANSMLSLSRMTLTHEMVRMFFVEQLYRAFTIIRGENYHHD